MATQNLRMGILLMVATTFIFSLQDAISRYLATDYNPYMIVMVRFWGLALFVCLLTARSRGGFRAAFATKFPVLQPLRGVILAVEICVMFVAFRELGLINSHAIFSCCPLLVAALSGPVLGERVGWRRWMAIGFGAIGTLIILSPGGGVFSAKALIALAAAVLFALYGLCTRYVSRGDPAPVSFFWMGMAGAVFMTPFGLMHWQAMAPADLGWLAILCLISSVAHFLMIWALEMAEASALQPFTYLQLVFISALGVIFFGERLAPNVALGAGVVVVAGLFTFWRERVRAAEVQRRPL